MNKITKLVLTLWLTLAVGAVGWAHTYKKEVKSKVVPTNQLFANTIASAGVIHPIDVKAQKAQGKVEQIIEVDGKTSYAVPPPNDDCDNAIIVPAESLPYNHVQDASEATGGAIYYSHWGGPAGSGGLNDGVWYKFHPIDNNKNYTIQVEPYDFWNPEIGVFTGSCNNWVYETHADSHGDYGMEEVVLQNPGDTDYYIDVGYWSVGVGSEDLFNISVKYTPENDNSVNAITIAPTELPYNNTLDASGATNIINPVTGVNRFVVYHYYGGPANEGMNDGVWFKFTPEMTSSYTLEVISDYWNAEIGVFSGNYDNLTYVAHKDDSPYGSNSTEILTLDLVANTTYYINIGYYDHEVNKPEREYTLKLKQNIVPVTGVMLEPTSAVLDEGETLQLVSRVEPANATNTNVIYGTSNAAVATVDDDGLVTAVSQGDAIISVETVDGGFNSICSVEVNSVTVPVTGVTLTPTSTSLTVGETQQLTASVQPANATNTNVSWSSDNTAIATVSSTGLVTGVAPGTAVITVTTVDGGYTATCNVTVQSNTVAVTGVTLTPTSANLTVGETQQLIASVQPTNATNTNVSWSCSNTSIVTVNNSGLITAVNPGNATVTVTTVDGGYTAVCSVTVEPNIIPVTGVSIDPATTGIVVGQTKQLTAIIQPANATNTNLSWSSNNTAVATVNSSGLVTAVAVGTTVVTVTTVDGGFTANCNIIVESNTVAVTGVSIAPTSISIESGQVAQLTATVQPINATNTNVSWSCSNTSIVTVNDNGLITALSPGNANVTVTTEDGAYTATCSVTVTAGVIAVTGVTVTPTSANLTVGETQQLTASVQPANATNTNVSWSCSNTSIITVNNSGLITAVNHGNATITVTTVDGGYTAICRVEVGLDAINELNIAELIKVYPNPSQGDIHIDAADATYDLHVLDATGRLVMRKQISGLSDIHIEEAGMYVLQFVNQDISPVYIKVIVRK